MRSISGDQLLSNAMRLGKDNAPVSWCISIQAPLRGSFVLIEVYR